MSDLIKITGLAGAIFIMLVLVIFSPFLLIWGMNTLFPALAIPYSLETWAAVIAVKWAFSAKVTFNK